VPGDRAVRVSWSAPLDDGGAAISGYRVQVSTAGTVVRTLEQVPASATATVVAGLEDGTAYVFRVAAVNEAGTSAWSAPTEPVRPHRQRDGVRPALTWRSPGPGSGRVAPGVTVRVRFSEPVAGVSRRTVRLVEVRTGRRVRVDLEAVRSGRTVRIDPRARLHRDTRYRVLLVGGRHGLRDLSGEELRSVRWSFRTR